ncbi:MAG: DUF58 domain-containing protein [Saprospiraceae bacterium]|nr:DUF58 domain-containing protein [Saprospiraceae bacterium]MBK7812392.1 DUF58 domain-containing protein [Saprospiraceae bacterium]MBK9632383.1 DUF58 domain-containing protein [Saprospiraceae bacterium]
MSFFDQFPVQAFDNMELLARQVVEGFIIGKHKSPFHGFSVEFAEHRLYNPGESTRDIDWRVYGRTDRLYSKKFEEETNLRCQLVIDASSSMYFPEEKLKSGLVLNKLKYSSLAAACIMNILKTQRDAFGISIFGENLEVHTQAKSSTKHYQLCLSFMDKYIREYELNKKGKAADALHQIAEQVHKRSLVILFSDMFDDADKLDEIVHALQHLKFNKHEVVVFHVSDKRLEVNFEFENRPYQFVDMETGEQIRIQSHQIREQYINHVKEYHSKVRDICIRYKIDYYESDINEGYNYLLQQFLGKRNKML